MVLSLGWFIRVLCDEVIKENPKKIQILFFPLFLKKKEQKKNFCAKRNTLVKT
jgi:hypothetical protein